jgi:hypothetical protein
MGELVVDASGVRAVARRVLDVVDAFDEIHWSAWDPDDLAGSSVSGIGAPARVADRMIAIAEQLHAWAANAQGAVIAFERTEASYVARLDLR